MTDQRELDRLLGDYFVDGTNELADRVIDAALDQIDHTRQRRRLRAPWRFPTMSMPIRLAAAAVIGVLVVGGVYYVTRTTQPSIGGPGPSPSAGPTATAGTTPAASPSPAANAWTAVGAPAVDRGVRGITIGLADGRVLVAGGGTGALKNAEIFDPAKGTWTPTGSMHDARSYPVAVRLTNGKVLVAGGNDQNSNLDSAELFDPATGVWTVTGSLTVTRQQAFAAVLSDGKVLVGGAGSVVGLNSSAELFDPATGRWTPTGDLATGRAGPLSATRLSDGRVLVAGGFAGDKRTAEIYEPASGKWTKVEQMHAERVDEQTAVLLTDGRVLICGGRPSSGDVFDPVAGHWTATRAMAGAYTDLLVSAVLPSGRVFLAGGGDAATAQLFDPATNGWSAIGTIDGGKFVRSASLLADGGVLVVTSSTSDAGGQPGATIYRPVAGS